MLDRLLHDLRYALRTLVKRPQFTLVAVLTLALGIGANTAIFNLVNGVLLKEVPGLEDTEGLVEISRDVANGRFFDLSYPVFTHLREENRVLRDMVAMTPQPVAFGEPGAAEVHMGLVATGNYFSLLRLQPSAGRFFAPEESLYPRVAASVVISDHLWESRFDRDPSLMGRTLLLNGHPVEVMGVAPRGFRGHAAALAIDVFVPLGLQAPGLHTSASLESPQSGIIEVLGRLEEGATRDHAATQLGSLATNYLQEHTSDPPSEYRVRVESWAPIPATVRAGVLAFFAVLMTIATLVLVMACINVSGMLLSRAVERRREVAIRQAIGAGRRRLVRQLLTEALVLFLAGGAAGLLLSIWATRLLLLFEPPTPPGFTIELDLGPDWRVFAFSFAISLVAGIVFSLAPATRSTRPDLVSALKEGGAAGSPGRSRFRSALVATQVAVTLILLIGAGLFQRALRSMESLDPGWDTAGVQVMAVDLEFSGYTQERGVAFYDELLARVRALPGVESAALARKPPLAGGSSLGDINVPGVRPPERRQGFPAFYNTVSPDYFRTLRLSMVEGRDFRTSDRDGAPRVAVINRAMADRFWPSRSAVGHRFQLGAAADGTEFEVIGVVENAKYRRLVEETPNFYYVPYSQRYNAQATLHLRTGEGAPPIAALRDILRELDPALPILAAQPLDEALGVFFLPQRLAAWVAGVMGLLGLTLAAVGVYGVTAFALTQRTREIGIRIALGARSSQVLRLLVRRGMQAPLLGMAAGLAVALGVTRLIRGLLAGVSPLDPFTFAAMLIVLAAVALGAILLPARKAISLDPVATLRAE